MWKFSPPKHPRVGAALRPELRLDEPRPPVWAGAGGDTGASVQEGIAEAQTELGDERIGVGLLCIGVGAMGEEEMDKSVTFLLENQAAFVGFDMAGAEQEVLRFEPFFRRVRDAGIPATCRASEDLKDGKPQNALDA